VPFVNLIMCLESKWFHLFKIPYFVDDGGILCRGQFRIKILLSMVYFLITWSRCSTTFSISNWDFLPSLNHWCSSCVSCIATSFSCLIYVDKVFLIMESIVMFFYFVKSSIILLCDFNFLKVEEK
jgi:hypothetical protein